MSEDCPHCVFEKTEANCRGCFEWSHYKPKLTTNADRIRSMSDEELAEFLERKTPWYRCDNCKWESCKDCCLDWLKGEAEGGGV